MRLFTAPVLFALMVCPVAAADEAADAAKKLEGTYTVVEMITEGKPDKKKDEVESIVIKDGEIIIKSGKRDQSAKFTLDPSKKPGHIDVTPKGDDKVLGIYEVKETDKGTELTIAFTSNGKDRPKDFKGEGNEAYVLKLFRKKE